MPEEPVTTDFGTRLLELLEALLIPDWGDLITFLPLLLVFGLIGPVLTLLFLYWAYVRLTSRRGRVRIDDPQPEPASRTADGAPIYPPNVPYCPTHELVYPAAATNCDVDREELLVRCPVDDMTRVAGQQVCRVCGTRYELGASLPPAVVTNHGRPPEGGAAVA